MSVGCITATFEDLVHWAAISLRRQFCFPFATLIVLDALWRTLVSTRHFGHLRGGGSTWVHPALLELFHCVTTVDGVFDVSNLQYPAVG